MDLQKLVSDVYEIIDAQGNYDNLSDKEVYAPSIQVERRNVYFILHETQNKQTVKNVSGLRRSWWRQGIWR